MEWRRGPSPGVTTGSAWAVRGHQALITDWAQALSTLSSSQPPPVPPAADSAQQTCEWLWKVLSVSVYFLFQTLGILTFIIQSLFMAPIRKNKFIYTDFIFNKEIRHHFSVHTKLTAMETAQPRLCRNRTVDEGGEHKSGWGRDPMGSSDRSPHLLTLC